MHSYSTSLAQMAEVMKVLILVLMEDALVPHRKGSVMALYDTS